MQRQRWPARFHQTERLLPELVPRLVEMCTTGGIRQMHRCELYNILLFHAFPCKIFVRICIDLHNSMGYLSDYRRIGMHHGKER